MKKILIYTLSTCPWCRRTKQFFTDRGISFDYVDYDLQSPEIQEQIERTIMESGSNVSFPWALIGDKVVVGWNPEKYVELLGLTPGGANGNRV